MSGCWSHVVATNPIFTNAALEPSNIASFSYFSTEAVSSSSCMQQAGGDLKQQQLTKHSRASLIGFLSET